MCARATKKTASSLTKKRSGSRSTTRSRISTACSRRRSGKPRPRRPATSTPPSPRHNRRMVRFFLCGAVAAGLGFAQTSVDSPRVAALLQRAIVLDIHDDTTQMILDEHYNLGESHTYGQVDIPRMRKGHIGGLFLSIWTDSERY